MDQTQPNASSAKPVPDKSLRRAIAASAIGNATEWFDYGIYAYGIAYISAALFPGSTDEATLFALATFAISFLIRPLGGIFWGRWAIASGVARYWPSPSSSWRRRPSVSASCPIMRASASGRRSASSCCA